MKSLMGEAKKRALLPRSTANSPTLLPECWQIYLFVDMSAFKKPAKGASPNKNNKLDNYVNTLILATLKHNFIHTCG